MGSNQTERLQAVRSPIQTIGLPRGRDEQRIAEIVRDIQELGFRLAKPRPTPTHVDSEKDSPKATKLKTFSAISEQRIHHPMKEVAVATRRGWRPSYGVLIIALFLVSSWAVFLIGPQHTYRRATTELQRLISFVMNPVDEKIRDAHRNSLAELQSRRSRGAGSVTPAPTESDEKAQAQQADSPTARGEPAAEEADRKATHVTVVGEVPRREEGAQTPPLERDKVEALPKTLLPQVPTTSGKAAEGQLGLDGRLRMTKAAREVTEAKPISDAEVMQQAQKAEADLKLSEQDRKEVQVALNSLGYKFPTVTGIFGQRTRGMIRAWQEAQGLPETGYLTEAQLSTLRRQATTALAK